MSPPTPEPETFIFPDSGEIPNNPVLPVILYRGAGSRDPESLESLFRRHGWPPAWRYGVYDFPHYHSTAHEVLGIYRGRARLRLGHAAGRDLEVEAGDVILIPAGVGHQNPGSSLDFHVVGAYPCGQQPDLLRGTAGERPEADVRIARVPLPVTDPVRGGPGLSAGLVNNS